MKISDDVMNMFYNNESFALFAHISPDGDAIGSCNALKLALKAIGKRAVIFCDGQIPFDLRFLNVKLEDDEHLIKMSDVCVLVDCCEFKRIGRYGDIVKAASKLVAIDHHAGAEPDIKLGVFDSTSASAAELVYEVIKQIGIGLSKKMAESIYAGVSTDTGGFKHGNTTAHSFKVAEACAETGFDLAAANFNLFKLKPSRQLEFYKLVFKNTLSLLDDRLIVIKIDNKTYNKYIYNYEATHFIDLLTGLAGNEIVANATEKTKGHWQLSFRSSRGADVSKFAKNFGGGGHKLASGGTMDGTFKQVVKKLLECSKEFLNR